MTKTTFQVTALFGNTFLIVGRDEYADKRDALKLAQIYRNTGREVHVHEITRTSSRLVEAAL